MSCNPIYREKKYKNEEEVIKAILQDIEKAKIEIENINSEILNSNSWKATEKLRKIKRKFK